MDRQKILIVISTIFVLFLLGGGYWYLAKQNILPTPRELFPGEAGLVPGPIGGVVTPPEEEVTTPKEAPLFPRLYELHKTPVAGVGFYEEGVAPYQTTVARYIERGLGHVFETPLTTNVVESRIVNETRPRIVEAFWGKGGRSVVVRFLDDKNDSVIKTKLLNLGAPATSLAVSASASGAPIKLLETEEIFLPDHIPFVSVAEDNSDKLFYLENGDGATTGSVSTFRASEVSRIFNSSFTEWLPQFPNKDLVTLTTKPSAAVPGHIFFIDLKNSSIKKIFGGLNGLTTLTSHDGKFVLYSETKDNLPELFLYDVNAKTPHSLSLKTLPEKCVWGNKISTTIYCAVPQNIITAEYPDQWYQGLVAFSDDIWEINAETKSVIKIMSPHDFGAPLLDIINPTLSQKDSYMVFMNKLSGTPWVYRFAEAAPSVSAPIIVATTTSPETTSTSTATTTKTTVPSSVITSDMQKLK